jgi:hypothetical protein
MSFKSRLLQEVVERTADSESKEVSFPLRLFLSVRLGERVNRQR